MLRRRRIGAREQQAEVGVVRTGGPHLLTVDHELVTVGNRARAEVREVRAGVGLAEQLAPDLVRAQQRPEVARLLVGAPVRHQRRAGEGDRRRDEAAAHVVARFLLAVDRLLPRSAAAPAVRHRPGDAGEPAVVDGRLPGAAPGEVLGLGRRILLHRRRGPVVDPAPPAGMGIEERDHLAPPGLGGGARRGDVRHRSQSRDP